METSIAPPPTFEPEITQDNGFGEGATCVRLSHGMSFIIEPLRHKGSFHFGGLMEKLRFDEQRQIRKEFQSKRGTLYSLLGDISLGLENLKKIIDEKKIEIPDTVSISTNNPFLARIYRGLPETSIRVKMFPPDEYQEIRVTEDELPDLLTELPHGLEFFLTYDYIVDMSKVADRERYITNLIDKVFQPRVSELSSRIAK